MEPYKQMKKPVLLGPYQVIDVVSKDVYIVESLLGKTRTIHASRLWFYGDKKSVGNLNLKPIFTHNFQSLEIDKIKKITLFSQPLEYICLVSWLGFSKEDDTWEPLNSLYSDVPLLIRAFINNIKGKYKKEALLKHLSKLDSEKKNFRGGKHYETYKGFIHFKN
eukprot:maker-scaffold_58-snap-gene-0.20-mRNA-1 protein AED:0.30 eAED:0.37 QI:0/0/0/1/0/0/2/0/163